MCMHMQLCGIRHTCLCVQDTYVHLCAYLCMMDGHKGVCIYISQQCILDFPDGSRVKKLLVNAGDMSSTPGHETKIPNAVQHSQENIFLVEEEKISDLEKNNITYQK